MPRPAPLATVIEDLHQRRVRFTPQDRAAKRTALVELARRRIENPELLLRYHDTLCFLRAYPDAPDMLALVEGELERFHTRIEAVVGSRRSRMPAALEASGMAATRVTCPFSFAAARWVLDRHPGAIAIDWSDDESAERLVSILPLLNEVSADEALVEAGVDARAWIAAAKGDDPRSDLAWILDRLDHAPTDVTTRRAAWDALAPRLRWDLGDSPASRTRTGLPVSRVFFHRGPLVQWRGPIARRLPGAPVRVRRVTGAAAETYVDAGRAAVLVRYREIHAFNFADPADVLIADLGRGVAVAWFGVAPEHRLPLRAHFGYLLVKNGVPIGYGDASLLFGAVEIAYNIFEAFRAAESTYVFARLLAFLHQHLGIRTFRLSPYQIGRGNDEALQTGAFWFYDKLGFRSARPHLAALAASERRRVAEDPGWRSSRATLERLCGGELVAQAGRNSSDSSGILDARGLLLRAAQRVDATDRVAAALGVDRWRSWPAGEQRALVSLSPVLALIPDLPRWSHRDRQALVAVIRAKAGRSEIDYVRRTQRHRRLREALTALTPTRN